MDFVNSGYAKRLFEGQIPELIRTVKRIAENQEKMMSCCGNTENATSSPAHESPNAIFVCYEENSRTLYSEAGNINKLFVTSDIELAKEWARRSMENAEENGYRPMEDQDCADFMQQIGEKFVSLWVYLEKRENARENYGICVDSFSLDQSKDRLEHCFPSNR